MQTLRKKTSPLKYKNETVRFVGDGVCFKAKLIGILEVSEARGDRMCQEALSDLKMAIRAAGEHKQRITINIAIDGLRLRDEKTGDSLYHHPVHKISFIAQDMSDSRAFGYIFGSPDTGHRFFGIKTDKAASQVVIAMRDLFQVVFAIKKKEIEMAKKFVSSPIYSDRSLSNSKSSSPEPNKNASSDSKGAGSLDSRPTPAVADLVDLELELNSLQQGLTQMERITPSDPFGPKDDPFGDSFTSYPQKPILPPPPSGRERANRVSESSSLFSPKTPHTAASHDSTNELFASRSLGTPKDFTFNDFNSSHDEPSSGDWFTPPAGNSLFEEAPPPKAAEAAKDQHEAVKQEIMSQFDVFTELDPLGTKANDTEIGTGKIKPYVDKKHFFQELKNPPKKVLNDLVSAQPLEASLFPANFEQTTNSGKNVYSGDPFGEDPFGQDDPFAEADFAKNDVFEEFSDFKVPVNDPPETKNNGGLTRTEIFGLFESPKKSVLEKQVSLAGTSPRTTSIFKQSTFDSTTQFDYKKSLTKLYENPSLDLSSESECAPDPPPRPSNTLPQIKPPPLPPKKQLGDLSAKPPPRPPHTEESHYDYMDKYETSYKTKSPPLPVPLRKSKFESDFQPEEEDYLTPVSFPTVKKAGPVLLPPPQRANKKKAAEAPQNLTNLQLDGLDITLSQLTLSGLNELAQKLQIPANQLSNMTLVQLTTFLSNFIKNTPQPEPQDNTEDNFKADFADFNNFSATSNSTYDRYAVFRELLQEETIKQTKIDEEPQEITEEKVVEVEEAEEEEEIVQVVEEVKEVEKEVEVVDRYAALREIVESELKITDTPRISEEIEEEDEEEEEDDDHLETIDEVIAEQNNINDDLSLSVDPSTPPNSNDLKIIDDVKNDNSEKSTKESIIDYNNVLDNSIISIEAKTSPKSKSPIPIAVAEIQNNARLNSGSISDVISGSSPEVDLTGSENAKKTDTGESWAIFDQPNLGQEGKEAKAGQSEEGVSPWSSDSKEYGNGSPPDWRQRIDSGSGGDQWGGTARRRDQEGWWDTSAEPEVQYYPSNRRSTDSYEDECYDCYERPRRRRQTTWSGQATGGHSSSSRDVSPWEEEPRRRDGRQSSWSSRHSRQHSFERHSRRHTDSWDEEDDYEYEDEHSGRFHWPERHGSRESDRERHVGGGRELERDRHGGSGGRELDEWEDRRVHRRRREMDRERWCCPDYDLAEPDKPSRYSSGRWSNPERRKYEDRYYGKEQESPWEDEYGGEIENPQPHYLTARRTRIRPSSASEMDRKTGEIKSRPGQYYYGGSDGERDRRYKSGRRSKSRDSSQYSDPTHRHKPETLPRNPHRLKQHQKFDPDFPQDLPPKKPDGPPKDVLKKPPARSKKQKESPKSEEPTTFPRKSAQRAQSLFENDFVPEPEAQQRFSFENEFETSEADSPLPKPKPKKKNWFDEERRGKKMTRYKQKSLFEDDFSPTDKAEGEEIPSIKEEFLEESDTVSSDLSSRKRLMKIGRIDMNLKKSESVNIFGRENDPFDDDFFSGANGSECSDLKWTQQFSDFDIQRAK